MALACKSLIQKPCQLVIQQRKCKKAEERQISKYIHLLHHHHPAEKFAIILEADLAHDAVTADFLESRFLQHQQSTCVRSFCCLKKSWQYLRREREKPARRISNIYIFLLISTHPSFVFVLCDSLRCLIKEILLLTLNNAYT